LAIRAVAALAEARPGLTLAIAGSGRLGDLHHELEQLQLAGHLVKELKMELHAGHGLDYYNVSPVARIEGMDCLNIGFSIISRGMFVGLKTAVSEMKRLIQ